LIYITLHKFKEWFIEGYTCHKGTGRTASRKDLAIYLEWYLKLNWKDCTNLANEILVEIRNRKLVSVIDKINFIDYNKIREANLNKYGVESTFQVPEFREKRLQTFLNKYGVDNPSKSLKVKEKRKQTFVEHFGAEHPMKTEEIKDKIKNTNLQRYGVECTLQSEEVKVKIRDTCIEKYGFSSPAKSDIVKEKKRRTFIDRYGVNSPFESDEVRKKSKETLILNYGVDSPLKSPEILDKAKQTFINNYGVDNPLKSKEVRDKIIETYLKRRSSPERLDYIINRLSYRYDVINIDRVSEVDVLLTLRCKYCGTEMVRNLKNLNSHTGYRFVCDNVNCITRTSNGHSQSELDLRVYVQNLLHDESIGSSRNLIYKPDSDNFAEVDIYIPSFNIAIEYDGVYWHKDLDNYYKFDKCREKGVRLIQIFEHEWCGLQHESIKAYLRQTFGIFENKVGARKCIVKEVPELEYREFLDDNHLQGYIPATVKLGLYYNDILLEVMSFGKPRFDKSYDYELLRECTLFDWKVYGGKEKLFKYFIDNYFPSSIISYCDKSKFTGNSYLKCGFRLLGETGSNYFYIKDGQIISRYQAQKSKLKELLGEENFNDSLTEVENMTLNGWVRLFNYGNYKYIWENNTILSEESDILSMGSEGVVSEQ